MSVTGASSRAIDSDRGPGAQRSSELVGHVGEELGLVAARGLELSALVGDLSEEPGVLDREGRLGREGRTARTL
jgi:hypothetical protein